MPSRACPLPRLDGRACGARVSSRDAEFCAHHERLIERYGEEAVRAGRVPRRRNPRSEERLVLDEAGSSNGSGASSNGSGAASPSQVRPRLAEAAASSFEEIRQTLLDAALGASKGVWVTFACGECGKKERHEVTVPDWRSRLQAVEVLLREALGRPAQSEEPPAPRMPGTADDVRKMSWDDLQALFAVTFVNEIAAVVRDGGAAQLHKRVASLDDETRRLLSEALAKVTA